LILVEEDSFMITECRYEETCTIEFEFETNDEYEFTGQIEML